MNLVLMWSHVYLVPFLYCFLLPTIPHLRFLLPFAAEHNVEGSMEKEIRPWLLRETIPLQVGGSDWKRRDRWSDRFTALSLSLEVQLLTHHSWPMMLELCSKPLLFDDNGVALPNIYIYSELSMMGIPINQYNQLKQHPLDPVRWQRTYDRCELMVFHTPFPWGFNLK